MKKNKNVIICIEENSIGEELGIEKGDILISINESEVIDIFDYRYLTKEEYLEVEIEKPTGEIWLLEIEKDEHEDLGIVFESGLMDNAKSCSNKCVFCFIDQMPKGMRDTLYFKDDDSRLSFLQGNYVTLTNMKDEDLDRIIYYHLSPINISVHTTNLELRKSMLKNKNAVLIMEQIEKIANSGITMNFQIVLVKNQNDGAELEKTISDLSGFIPKASSLSVVPVGLTKFRDNLQKLEPFEKEDCLKVINTVENWQKKLKENYGTNFVFASDEFYIVAEKELPSIEVYEDFPQIENGVGMLSLFCSEFNNAFSENIYKLNHEKSITVATSEISYKYINKLVLKVKEKYGDLNIEVICVKNNFFGGKVTVSGLLTGSDIIKGLEDIKINDILLLPENMLKSNEEIFLDDITVEELSKKLNVEIRIVPSNGEIFLQTLLEL